MTPLHTQQLDDYDYVLPPQEQIAQHPLKKRSESRLLCWKQQEKKMEHTLFHSIIDYLSPKDLLIFNNTKVIPARLFGRKATGGRVEVLVERLLNEHEFLAHLRVSKPLRAGDVIDIYSANSNADISLGYTLRLISKQEDLFLLTLTSQGTMMDCLDACGHMPLPPYIQREDVLEDKTRYQTVYAEHDGAIAAPTAGLHFDAELMQKLTDKGIQQAFLTLHVGAGTFQPVRVSNIADHKMHNEYVEVSEALCEKIKETKRVGGRVVAVGTTVVRALESANLQPFQGDTDIFITPGYTFRVIDGMVTNFHWPKSTLLMLVSALITRETLLALYQEAITEKYRFFSYGDAMLII